MLNGWQAMRQTLSLDRQIYLEDSSAGKQRKTMVSKTSPNRQGTLWI